MIAQDTPDKLMQRSSNISLPTAMLWATFDRKLKFVLPEIPTDGSLSDAFGRLSLQANATFSLDRNITSIVNRAPIGALLENSIIEDTQFIDLKNINRQKFPSSGSILINSEIVFFNSIVLDQLGDLTRGYNRTNPGFHQQGSQITFLDAAFNKRDLIGEDIFWSIDTLHLYNNVRDENRLIQIRDEFSVYAEKTLNINLGLDNLRIPLLNFIAEDYLHRFKDIRFLLNFSLRRSFYLKIADIVGFYYDPLPPITMRIMDITYQQDQTIIKGRQIEPDIIITPDALEAEPDTNFRILDPQNDPMAVTGNGDHLLFIGDNSIQTVEPIIFEKNLDDLSLTQFEKIEPILMPPAIGGTEPYKYSMNKIPEGMFFNPRTRYFYGSPEIVLSDAEAEYIVIDNDGVTHRETFEIDVSITELPQQRILDPQDDPIAVAGNGDHLIYWGSYNI